LNRVRVKDLLPIPNLLAARRILVVQAHPDDAEVGAGATVAKLTAAGVSAAYLTVTDGHMGTEDPSIDPAELVQYRRREGEAAARTLGVAETFWLDFPDGGSLNLVRVREQITRVIRLFKPDALLVNDPWLPYEAHSDHRVTGFAAVEACLYSGLPHYCKEQLQEDGLALHKVDQVALYTSPYPNTYIDVTDFWAAKLDALQKHQSQFSPEMVELLSFYLTEKARELAQDRGCEMVEAFKVLTTTHLHCFEETWMC
jgi:N,N'-diacetylchitobiose non-reducing end deacetylase